VCLRVGSHLCSGLRRVTQGYARQGINTRTCAHMCVCVCVCECVCACARARALLFLCFCVTAIKFALNKY
jgi:hypothetical protein